MYPIQNPAQKQQPQQNQQPPVQPKPEYEFKWEIFLGIPLVVAVFIYVLKNIEPSFQFEDLLDKLEIIHRTKYARLACMAVLCLAFILIVKLFRNKRD